MHERLKQQLEQTFGSVDNIPEAMDVFINLVDETYQQTLPAATVDSATASASITGYRYNGETLSPLDEPSTADSVGDIAVPIQLRGKTLGKINLKVREKLSETQTRVLVEQISNRLALAIDNAKLFQASQESLVEQKRLLRIVEGRAIQLQTASEVARAATSLLRLDELLPNAVELIRERFGLYYVGVFLLDPSREWAVLRAGTGDAGRVQMERNHRLRVGSKSMIGSAIEAQTARIAFDVGKEAVHFQNPYLPDTRSELALPLISRGEARGALTVQSTQEAAFSDEDITTLQTMADQLANAIQNASFFEQTQQQTRELGILNEMATVLTTQLNEDLIAESLYNYTSRLMETPIFLMALYDAEKDEVRFPMAMEDNQPIHLSPRVGVDGLTEYVIKNRRALFMPDRVNERLEKLGLTQFITGAQALSWLGVPMTVGTRALGMLSVQSHRAVGHFDERHLDLLTSIANQAAIALENARLYQESQQRLAETADLYRASSAINAAQTYDQILKVLRDYTLLAVGEASISVFDRPWRENDEPEWAIPVARSFVPEGGLVNRYSFAEHPAKGLMKPNEPTIIDDIATDDRLTPLIRDLYLNRLKAQSVLFVPLIAGGQWIGYINAIYQQATDFPKDDLRRLVALAGQAAVAVQNLYQIEQVQARVAREQVLSEITALVHSATNADTIMKKATEEIGRAFGRKAFIYLDED